MTLIVAPSDKYTDVCVHRDCLSHLVCYLNNTTQKQPSNIINNIHSFFVEYSNHNYNAAHSTLFQAE
ncbi:unnamed protein product [Spodoptera exigua]|nr:unnamed protein product [Spodoptera exigua]